MGESRENPTTGMCTASYEERLWRFIPIPILKMNGHFAPRLLRFHEPASRFPFKGKVYLLHHMDNLLERRL